MIAYVVAITMIPVCLIIAAIVMTLVKGIMKLKPTPGTMRFVGLLFGALFAFLGLLGVNGVGKTTSIGKIAKWLRSEGNSVMLVYCRPHTPTFPVIERYSWPRCFLGS